MGFATDVDVVRHLNWRYAVKKFDATKKIPDSQWAALEQALVLAPSSFGLQPWKFWIVTNQDVKEQLVGASWNQTQFRDASHVVVCAIRKNLDAEHVDRYLKHLVTVRGGTIEGLAGFRKVVVDFLAQSPEQFNVDHWSAKQVYIALGQFMTTAAMMGIDTCPMEGINPAQYDKILKIGEQGYATVVAVTAGYRASDDKYATMPKVRFPHEQVIERIS
jgi:nitroreductase